MCNNVIALETNDSNIFPELDLFADPNYDIDANKPWWEITWKNIINWLANVFKRYNEIPWLTKFVIGIALFAAAILLTALTQGSWIPLAICFGTSVGISVFNGVDAAKSNGESLLDGALTGLGDGALWGGVFAAFGATVNYIKFMSLPKVERLAIKYTHNPKADKVMIGKWDGGGPTSYVARAGKDYTYFSIPGKNYDKLLHKYGEKFMWKINEAFLRQQLAVGKQFYASHLMSTATKTFKQEILYVGESLIKQLYF